MTELSSRKWVSNMDKGGGGAGCEWRVFIINDLELFMKHLMRKKCVFLFYMCAIFTRNVTVLYYFCARGRRDFDTSITRI